MKIISHRGIWYRPQERNTEFSFLTAFEAGFGIETDIRDSIGSLVISHDPPTGSEMTFERFLELSTSFSSVPLALNIKCDGVASAVRAALEKYSIDNYFVFDMSIPDMKNCLDEGLNVFSRLSEVEPTPTWLEKCTGVWLDSFYEIWFANETIEKFLVRNKQVCIVSPELHGRDYRACWDQIKEINDNNLMLCTDFPVEAQDFFGA